MSYFNSEVVPKSQAADKTAATFHYFHSFPKEDRVWDQDFIQVVSIDPAIKNFAIRIEKIYNDGRIVPIRFGKYDVAGEIIDTTPKNKKFTLKNVEQLTSRTFSNINNVLDEFQDKYEDCHYILIERQLPKNHKMVKVMQHIISYFSVVTKNMPLLPWIVEIDPKLKGAIFGFGKCDYNVLKKKTTTLVREILTNRDDNVSLGIMDFWKSKQDDLADTVIMILAFFVWIGYFTLDELYQPNFVKNRDDLALGK